MLGVAASVVYHAALGLALAALVWVVGVGALALLRRSVDVGRPLVDAYPLGLAAVVVAAVPPLIHPALWVVSLGALAPLAWGGRHLLVRPAAPRRFVLPIAGSAGFGIGLGALLHGPTDQLGSAAYGGMLFYVDKVVAATRSIFPFHDLLAEGEQIIYPEAGTSFVGAALSVLPGFDPVLYNGAALPAFALASLCAGFAAFTAGRDRNAQADGVTIATVTLLSLAIVVYPTWMTETPPAAFALPLAFPLYRIWRDAIAPGWLVFLSALVAFDYLLTKVLGVVPLGLLLLAGLLERARPRPDFHRLVAIGAVLVAVGAATVIALLFLTAGWYATLLQPKALPLDVARAFADSDANPRTLGLAALIAGEVLFVVALARARWYALLVPTALLLPVTWFVAGYAFDIALGTVIFVSALELRARGGLPPRLTLVAAALLGLSVVFRDVLGARPGLALSLLAVIALLPFAGPWHRRLPLAVAGAGAAVLLALADVAALGLLAVVTLGALAYFGTREWVVRAGVAACAAVAVGAAAYSLRAGAFDIGSPAPTLTPADYDIWEEVRRTVPEDGLVFTTMTGPEVTPYRGWNNYPSIAGRQLFIAGWYDGRLVAHPEDRARRLELNERVFGGELAPLDAELSRSFSSFYAVTELGDDVPPSFERLYANDRYVLYEIP